MSRCRNLSSNRDDLRYCDSERAVSDLEVWTGVTGQTAFTHMGRAHGRSRVQSWIRDRVTELRSCNGAGWCANPPKAGRFLRRREAGGVKESMRGGGWLDLGAAAAVGCGLGRAGSRYQRQFAALPLSARRGVHFACEDEPSSELAACLGRPLQALPAVFNNLPSPTFRWHRLDGLPAVSAFCLSLCADRQRVSMSCAANDVCTIRCVFSPHYST